MLLIDLKLYAEADANTPPNIKLATAIDLRVRRNFAERGNRTSACDMAVTRRKFAAGASEIRQCIGAATDDHRTVPRNVVLGPDLVLKICGGAMTKSGGRYPSLLVRTRIRVEVDLSDCTPFYLMAGEMVR